MGIFFRSGFEGFALSLYVGIVVIGYISEMGEHLLVYVDRIVKPDEARSIQPVQEANLYENRAEMVGPSSSSSEKEEDEMMEDEGAPLIGIAECRICQEEESINNLEIPCSCSGSLKVC